MRYIPIEELKEGMTIGQDIINSAGNMLIGRYQDVTEKQIEVLKQLGYIGIYIEDEISKEVEINEILCPEIRKLAMQTVSKLFVEDKDDWEEDEKRIRKMVSDVVEAVIQQKQIMYNMIDLKNYDEYTYFHSVNVALVATYLGANLGITGKKLENLATAGMLHDIGKKALDIEVLNARRGLSPDEEIAIKMHPEIGYHIIKEGFHFDEEVALGILEHHERYDGGGYPKGKKSNETSEFAKIIKIADVYDAMTSKRPYREALLPNEVMEFVMGNSCKEFDPEIVSIFVRKMAIYPSGVKVRLSNGIDAIVVKNYEGFSLRPLLIDMNTSKMIDLKNDRQYRNITITKLLV